MMSDDNQAITEEQRMIKMSTEISELAAALSSAQGDMDNPAKNAENKHFKAFYADLAEVVNVSRPVLAKHGLSLTQSPTYSDGIATVTTLVLHKSGQWLMDTAAAPVGKQDVQSVMSAFTYLRRHSRAAFCGIAQEDDDGNAASRAPKEIQRITPEQVADLDKLLTETGSDEAKFLKYVQADTLEDIQAAAFDDAVTTIKSAARRRKLESMLADLREEVAASDLGTALAALDASDLDDKGKASIRKQLQAEMPA